MHSSSILYADRAAVLSCQNTMTAKVQDYKVLRRLSYGTLSLPLHDYLAVSSPGQVVT